jgi:DNA topoisomerase-2
MNTSKKTIEQIYQKKTPKEHILLRPDTYVGSMEKEEQLLWVKSTDSHFLEKRKITLVPALYKIFDEIIVNAADNYRRDPNTNKIKVTINRKKNMIKVRNNGQSIPIEIHKGIPKYLNLIFRI